MDLSTVFSKTPKGLRARASLIGGLSAHLMKVLTHIDGSSKAETILLKIDNLSPQQLSADLKRLEQEGYIRLTTVTVNSDDGWALTTNFTPMVVEEYQSEEELEAIAKAQNEAQARLDAEQKVKEEAAQQLAAEQKAKQEQERQLAAAQKAEKKAQKLREKEKTKAEVKVKAQLDLEREEAQRREQKRIAEEAAKAAEAARIKAEAEAKLKAEQEAARIAAQQVAERAAKLEEEARQKAELRAREAAEQAEADAEAAAKEQARSEIERISREAEEAQRKAESEAKTKLEAEHIAAINLAKAEELARLQAAEQEKAQAQAEAEKAKLQAKADAEALQTKIKATEEAEMLAIQAREQALAEAKAQEKALEEQQAAQAAKEKAHSDIANVLRKAEQDRKNAMALAKAQKLEAKRQAKAEQEARVQAERKAKELAKEQAKRLKLNAQAEEKSKLEAAENAKREQARIAKEAELARTQAEPQANQVEQQAKQAETTRSEVENIGLEHSHTVQVAHAKFAAEEQAKIEAKENARLEMERISREADLVRQKSVTEQHIAETKQNLASKDFPILDDFDAAEAAEEAAFEAEERALQAKSQTHKVADITTEVAADKTTDKATQHAAEDAGRASIKDAARAEAEANASILPKNSLIPIRKVKQWLSAISKLTFIYVPVLLLVLLILAHFINLSTLIKPIEQLASDSLGVPVAIKKVHASLWPQPHLVLENVAIGASDNIKAIHVLPAVSSLFDEVKVAKSLVIDGLNIEQANFGQPLQWASNLGNAKNVKVEQINIKNLMLTIRDLTLEPFDGKVALTETGALAAIELVSSNNALSVVIKPQNSEYEIVLKAANWVLPFNQKIVFGALNAKGVSSADQIKFSQIEGEIYGGKLTGQANIGWPDSGGQWSGAGDYKLENAYAEQLLSAFGSAVTIDGKLTLSGSFSSRASDANQLAGASLFSANFDVRQGSIEGIELARAVLTRGGQSLAGDTTNFDKLTGSVKVNKGQYQFGKLLLSSPQLNASGYLNIAANQDVSGRVNADIAAQSRRLQANFGVTGRGKDLKSK